MSDSQPSAFTRACRKVTDNDGFDAVIFALLVVNAMALVAEVIGIDADYGEAIGWLYSASTFVFAVEIALPDRKISTRVKVQAPGEDPEAAKVPFVPFPVALPEDPELVWVLARREDLGPDEAARALASIEEEFWATKAGQKLQREGTEKSFADFIQNVPAAALADSGLKRHYKQPETLHALHLLHHKSPAEELGAALT
jgi:hypothetical protein